MVWRAVQSLHAVNDDGSEVFVPEGSLWPDGHPLVERDVSGVGVLFRREVAYDPYVPSAEARPRPRKGDAA